MKPFHLVTKASGLGNLTSPTPLQCQDFGSASHATKQIHDTIVMMVLLLKVLCLQHILLSNEFHCVFHIARHAQEICTLVVDIAARARGKVGAARKFSAPVNRVTPGRQHISQLTYPGSQQSDPGAPTYLAVNRVPWATSISWLTYQSDPGAPTYLGYHISAVNRVTLLVNISE